MFDRAEAEQLQLSEKKRVVEADKAKIKSVGVLLCAANDVYPGHAIGFQQSIQPAAPPLLQSAMRSSRLCCDFSPPLAPTLHLLGRKQTTRGHAGDWGAGREEEKGAAGGLGRGAAGFRVLSMICRPDAQQHSRPDCPDVPAAVTLHCVAHTAMLMQLSLTGSRALARSTSNLGTSSRCCCRARPPSWSRPRAAPSSRVSSQMMLCSLFTLRLHFQSELHAATSHQGTMEELDPPLGRSECTLLHAERAEHQFSSVASLLNKYCRVGRCASWRLADTKHDGSARWGVKDRASC